MKRDAQWTSSFQRGLWILIFAIAVVLPLRTVANAARNAAIRITHPINGSFVTTQSPTVVTFFIDEEGHCKHDAPEVVVSLDGHSIAELREELAVELPRWINAGSYHSVSVTLHENGRAIATHEVTFFVEQPSVQIISPTNATVLQKPGGESASVVLKLIVVVGSTACLFIEIGPRVLWKELDRSDHQLITLEVQHGDLSGGASDTDFPSVRLVVNLHDAPLCLDPTCTRNDGCAASHRRGALLSRDEVAVRVHVTEQPEQPSQRRGCSHAFLDLGSRDGGCLLRLTDPLAFWESSAPFNWFKNLTMLLAPDVVPGNVCLVGIEGNPNLAAHLDGVASALAGAGWDIEMLTSTAAWHADGEVQLRLDFRDPLRGWASSLLPRYDTEDDGEEVTVRAVDIGAMLRRTRQRLPAEGLLVLKMDIEGSEYEILRRIVADGTVCAVVDYLLMEWHPDVAPDVPANAGAAIQWLLDAPSCRTTLWPQCTQD